MDRRCALALATLMLAGGCLAPGRVCPGKATTTEALAALRPREEALRSFKATGQCRMGYVAESGRARQFNLPVNVYVNPPSEVYLQGQATLGPQGLVFLGTNEKEFWLGIRPEISTFWWGEWSKARGAHDLPVSPQAVFESLGLVVADAAEADPNRWSLSAASGQDVLTFLDEGGRPAKRLFVERCDYRIARIEYLDAEGRASVVVELKRYEKVGPATWVPSRISITAFDGPERTHWARLSLNSLAEWTCREAFRQRYLVRPEAANFKTVIEIGKDEK